jgi:hypothetical protein
MYSHTQLVCWHGVLLTFCLGWLWTNTLPVSASQITVITDVNHHVQLHHFIISTSPIWKYHNETPVYN